MDHYESTVIILNTQLCSKPASFTWKRSRTAFFARRFEKPTESESFWVTSLQEAVWKMLLAALGWSPICAWHTLKAGKHIEFFFCCCFRLLYGGVAIQVVLLLVRQFTQANWNVYWKTMTTFISGPESSWQKSKCCLYTYLFKQVVISKL